MKCKFKNILSKWRKTQFHSILDTVSYNYDCAWLEHWARTSANIGNEFRIRVHIKIIPMAFIILRMSSEHCILCVDAIVNMQWNARSHTHTHSALSANFNDVFAHKWNLMRKPTICGCDLLTSHLVCVCLKMFSCCKLI